MSWSGWADVVAWLDDMRPGRADRTSPPRLADDASQELLRTDAGRALLAWIAVRDEGVTYADAAALWHQANDEERHRLLSVLMDRRRTLATDDDDRTGTDIGQIWCGKGMATLAQAIGIEAIGRLTLDQLEWLLSDGECDQHADPARQPAADMQERWEEAHRRWKEQQAATP